MSKSEPRPTQFHAEALSLCHKAEAVVECLHYYFFVMFQPDLILLSGPAEMKLDAFGHGNLGKDCGEVMEKSWLKKRMKPVKKKNWFPDLRISFTFFSVD